MTAAAGSRPAMVPADERVIVMIRPDPLFVVLRTLGLFVGLAIGAAGTLWAITLTGIAVPTGRVFAVAMVLGGAQFLWNALEWWNRTYVLTDRRVMRLGGVLQRLITEVPLERVQGVTVSRLVRERVFGLGSVGVSSAGTGSIEVAWVMVARPAELVATIRRAADDYRSGADRV